MTLAPRSLPFAAVALLALASCNGDKLESLNVDGSGDPSCTGPVASAGVDLTGAPGGSVRLDGSASSTCDGSITYNWSVEAVPVDSAVDNGDLDLTDPAAPSLPVDLSGTYVVSLVVSDGADNVSSPDLVVIEVSAASSAPVADCGGNQSVTLGDRVQLDGSGSSDPEGAAISYRWTLAGVPECSALVDTSLYNANTATPSFVPDCASVFLVNLVVSDGEQWSAVSQCSVTAGAGNQAPIAEAGPSGNLSPCTDGRYELNGWGSYDPEGLPLTYEWTLVSVPADSDATMADLSSSSIANPVFVRDVPGEYTFELRVHDGAIWSAPDVVVLNFQDLAGNSLPIANAGADQTISREPDCETASYVFTCEDCPVDDVTIDGSASDDPVDGDELSFVWYDATRELDIVSPNSPITSVNTPSFASEYNTTVTRTWDVELAVSDCADSDRDTVRITYNCTGQYSR